MLAFKAKHTIGTSKDCRLAFAVLGIERTMIEFVSLAATMNVMRVGDT